MDRNAELSTRILLDRARGGDEAARDQLFTRYRARLSRWASWQIPRSLRSLVDTDDLVQETFLGFLRREEQFDPAHSGAFEGYLRQICRNRVLERRRHLERHPEGTAAETAIPTAEPSPIERLLGREQVSRLEAALERLNPRDRGRVLLHLELRFSHAEVAELLGDPSPDASRMALARTLQRLSLSLADRARA